LTIQEQIQARLDVIAEAEKLRQELTDRINLHAEEIEQLRLQEEKQ
jgi:hypothetical protein